MVETEEEGRTKGLGELNRLMEEEGLLIKRPMETTLSQWIRENRALLIVGGSLTAAGWKALAWIIEHIEDIQRAVDIVVGAFPSESGSDSLDFDQLTILGEDLWTALDHESLLVIPAVAAVAEAHGFSSIRSRRVDLRELGLS